MPKKKQLTATNKVVSSFSKLSPTATSFNYSTVSAGRHLPLQTKTTAYDDPYTYQDPSKPPPASKPPPEQQKQPHAPYAPPQTAKYIQEYSNSLQINDSLTSTSSYINDHMGGYHQRTTAAV